MFSRRHFLKASAAVTALSVIPPTAAVTAGAAPVINWSAFCCDDGGPLSLATPWFRNGYKLATNSRVLVRQYIGEISPQQVKEMNVYTFEGKEHLRLFPCYMYESSEMMGRRLALGQSIYEDRIDWRPWPYDAKPVYGFSCCPECDDSGLVGPYVPCRNGKHHGPTAYLAPEFCPDCNQNCEVGSVDCPMCTNARLHPRTREPFVPYAYRIGEKLIQRNFFELLSELPKPIEWFSHDATCGLILFRGRGFDGGLMTICNEQSCGDLCDEHYPKQETAADFGLEMVAVS